VPEPKREESGGSAALWLVLAALGAVAVYWFVVKSSAPPVEPTPKPTAEPQAGLDPPPAPTPTPTVATITDAAPTSTDAATAQETPTPPEKPERPVASETTTPPDKSEPPGKDDKPTGKDDKPTGKDDKPTGKDDKPAAGTGGSGSDVAMAAPFDASAARSALASAAGAASGCRKEGDPAGAATVVVTFAPSGRVTSANISGPPFAGTKTGGCIAAAMRSARVPPFSGDHVTVSKTVAIQ
jgi:hypothetical protein